MREQFTDPAGKGLPSVTVIVPTYNNGGTLGVCLESIRRQSVAPDELIVVDPGSSDDTRDIAREYATLIESPVANRCFQQNLAARSAASEFVCFIDADMRLDPEVVAQAKELCGSVGGPLAVVVPEFSFGSTFWARAKSFERSFYNGIWWMEFPRWIERELFWEAGGFDPTTLLDDWVLDEELRKLTSRIGRIEAFAHHDEGALQLREIAAKEAHYVDCFKEFRVRHPSRARLTMSVLHRFGVFLRRPYELLRHPVMTTALGVMGVAEFATGRGWYRPDDPWPVERTLTPDHIRSLVTEDSAGTVEPG